MKYTDKVNAMFGSKVVKTDEEVSLGVKNGDFTLVCSDVFKSEEDLEEGCKLFLEEFETRPINGRVEWYVRDRKVPEDKVVTYGMIDSKRVDFAKEE